MPTHRPLVSVIVPNYNHGRFLVQRLDSIYNQTHSDFEVILMDDASSDDSASILKGYSTRPKTRLVLNAQNSGSPFIQWNRGVKLACGKYVWIAESDDAAAPQLLEQLVAALETNPTAGLAYCQSLIIDDDNRITGNVHDFHKWLSVDHWCQDYVNNGRTECSSYLLFANTIPNASAVLFRRSLFERIGYADETMRLCGDWHIWCRMLFESDVAFVARTLNLFRQHNQSVRTSLKKTSREFLETLTVIGLIVRQCSIPVANRAILVGQIARQWAALSTNRESGLCASIELRIIQAATRIDSRITPAYLRLRLRGMAHRHRLIRVVGKPAWIFVRAVGSRILASDKPVIRSNKQCPK